VVRIISGEINRTNLAELLPPKKAIASGFEMKNIINASKNPDITIRVNAE
jgi:hypothetical protein